MKHYTAKKRMYKVAKPIIDIFFSEKSEDKRRKILRRVIGRTESFDKRNPAQPKPNLLNKLLVYVGLMNESLTELVEAFRKLDLATTRGYFDPKTGRIAVGVNEENGVYAHELIHLLGHEGDITNDYMMAHALESYTNNLPDYHKRHNQILNPPTTESVLYPENIRPLKFSEMCKGVNYEYEGNFDKTGRTLGNLAAYMEAKTGSPNSGLRFLKLINEGSSLEKALAYSFNHSGEE